MARPTRNNADYFTHSANLRNDRRIKAIRSTFGAAGYGLLIMLIEVLTDADYTQISTESLEVELLAGDFGVSVTEIDSLLLFAERIGVLTRDASGMLVCPDLNKWLEPVFEKRNRSRVQATPQSKGVSVTETNQSVTETSQSVTESTQSKEEKSKIKDKEYAGSDEPSSAPGSSGDALTTKEGKPDKSAYTPEFERFWQTYAKFSANKKRAFTQWQKLSQKDQRKATGVLPDYLQHVPEARFRKDPERWLSQHAFDNDYSASTEGVRSIGQREFVI